jgi:hypothetical protein
LASERFGLSAESGGYLIEQESIRIAESLGTVLRLINEVGEQQSRPSKITSCIFRRVSAN